MFRNTRTPYIGFSQYTNDGKMFTIRDLDDLRRLGRVRFADEIRYCQIFCSKNIEPDVR